MNGDELLENVLPPEQVYQQLPVEEQNLYNYKCLRHLILTFSHQPAICNEKFVTRKQVKWIACIFGAFVLGLGLVNWHQIKAFLSFI